MAHSTALIASIATSSRSVEPCCRDTRHLQSLTSDPVEPGDKEGAATRAARVARRSREREGDDALATVTFARRPVHNRTNAVEEQREDRAHGQEQRRHDGGPQIDAHAEHELDVAEAHALLIDDVGDDLLLLVDLAHESQLFPAHPFRVPSTTKHLGCTTVAAGGF